MLIIHGRGSRIGIEIERTWWHRRTIGLDKWTDEGKMMNECRWDIRTLKRSNENVANTYQVSQSHTNDDVSAWQRREKRRIAVRSLTDGRPTSVTDERCTVFWRSPSIAPTNVAGMRPISFVRKLFTYIDIRIRYDAFEWGVRYLPDMFIIVFDYFKFIAFGHLNVSIAESIATGFRIAIVDRSVVIVESIDSTCHGHTYTDQYASRQEWLRTVTIDIGDIAECTRQFIRATIETSNTFERY